MEEIEKENMNTADWQYVLDLIDKEVEDLGLRRSRLIEFKLYLIKMARKVE